MFKSIARLITLLIIISVASVLALPVAAQNDDDVFDFPFLENGDSVSASFEPGVDSQLYAFVASAGDRLTVRMVQSPATSPLDPFLIVFSEFGEVMAYDDDGGDNPYFSALIRDFNVEADGLYFVLATHKEGTRKSLEETIGNSAQSTLNYTLTLSGITPPVRFDLEDALDAFMQNEISVGGRVSAELSETAPVAFITFIGAEGQTVTLETSNPAGESVDTIIMLFDIEGRRIGINDDAPGIGLLSRITTELEVDGAHLALVTAYQYERTSELNFAWSEEGTTTLSLTATP